MEKIPHPITQNPINVDRLLHWIIYGEVLEKPKSLPPLNEHCYRCKQTLLSNHECNK